jgi:hypothetical protein
MAGEDSVSAKRGNAGNSSSVQPLESARRTRGLGSTVLGLDPIKSAPADGALDNRLVLLWFGRQALPEKPGGSGELIAFVATTSHRTTTLLAAVVECFPETVFVKHTPRLRASPSATQNSKESNPTIQDKKHDRLEVLHLWRGVHAMRDFFTRGKKQRVAARSPAHPAPPVRNRHS